MSLPNASRRCATAFDATMKDPQYLEEARRIGLDVNPLGGEGIARLIQQVQETPQDVVDRLRELIASPARPLDSFGHSAAFL